MKKIKLVLICTLLSVCYSLRAQEVFNSGFENWTGNVPNNWVGTQTTLEPDSIIQYTSNVHSGSMACRLVNRQSAPKKFSSSAFSLEAGTSYFVSYWVRGHGNISSITIYSGTSTTLSGFGGLVDTVEWIYHYAWFTAPTTSAASELVFSLKQTFSDMDDIQIDQVLLYTVPYAILDTNNISAKINADGSLFNSHFEVPKGSGNHTIYENNIWIGGLDGSSQLHLAADKYIENNNIDFFYGPMAINFTDSAYQTKYNRVWKINKSVIDYHIAHYSTTGYIVPSSIANWPGNGNISNGEMATLAPYYDANSNNTYDPVNGDYPLIRGDQAVFFMFNDNNGVHNSGGAKLGIEVHGLAYSFANQADSALNQTVFVNYEIFNRSANYYHDVYFGSFTDMDLGFGSDDFVGCDSLLNMFYTYNSTDTDGVGAVGSYGAPAPAQGAVFLNHPISKFEYFNNSNSGAPAYSTDPYSAYDYYTFLRGIWKDGVPMTYGGNGHGGTTPANFMFSGYPESGIGWTEINAGNSANDRRGVMSIGPFAIDLNEKLCVDLAFPFARDYTGTNLTSLALLRQRVQAIQTFYNNQGYVCEMPVVGVPNHSYQYETTQVFPNPNNGSFYVITPKNASIYNIEVYSMLGKMVFSKLLASEKTALDLGDNKGIFLYVIKSQDTVVSRGKIVVE